MLDPSQSFIKGPVLSATKQVIKAYDVISGSQWFDGLNSAVWDPARLLELTKAVTVEELDKGFVMTAAREDRGRGILSPRSFREGDTIMSLSCLFFDEVLSPGLLTRWNCATVGSLGVLEPMGFCHTSTHYLLLLRPQRTRYCVSVSKN